MPAPNTHFLQKDSFIPCRFSLDEQRKRRMVCMLIQTNQPTKGDDMTHTFNVSHIYDDSYDGDTFDALADALKARP